MHVNFLSSERSSMRSNRMRDGEKQHHHQQKETNKQTKMRDGRVVPKTMKREQKENEWL